MAIKDTVLVLTGNSIEQMLKAGGSGFWKANAQRMGKCRYLVATRNSRQGSARNLQRHGTAFLIGKISHVFHPVADENGGPVDKDRYVIALAEYGEINVPGVWTGGGSNPVHYAVLDDLPIDLQAVEWKSWPNSRAITGSSGLSIEEAKQGLAQRFGVDPERIEILIKG